MTHISLTACTIALVLWLNFAFIEHQYDLSNSHHSQHHCQMYASAHHGAMAALNLFPIVKMGQEPAVDPIYTYTQTIHVAYLARSPPYILSTLPLT
ncbi:DUF2607 family protein [Vibrio aquaticus]|uniref:DUF2607 family protein n=1 Tax=Vibrio aquaticus TaxID=2496559 RepID=UPI001FC9143E|nr:DUF2607 family protein [Vibrio aquaticus]